MDHALKQRFTDVAKLEIPYISVQHFAVKQVRFPVSKRQISVTPQFFINPICFLLA